MKTVDIIDGKLVIGNSFEFTSDKLEKVTVVDITADVIKALNLRIAKCVNNFENNMDKGIASADNNIIIYTKDGIKRHFSVAAYKEMVEAVNLLLNGKDLNDFNFFKRLQVLKALANMSEDLFQCCEKEMAIDIATNYLIALKK